MDQSCFMISLSDVGFISHSRPFDEIGHFNVVYIHTGTGQTLLVTPATSAAQI